MSDGVDVVTFDDYRGTVTERLETKRGFRKLDDGPDGYETISFHRRRFSILPPGFLDVVPVVARFATPAIRTVREFSSRAFAFASDQEATRPRALGGIPAALPVAACEDPGDDLKQWIAGFQSSHVRAFEFPVVVDMTRETVHYCSDTPMLGTRAYEHFRKLAAGALDPSVADPDLQEFV